MPATRAQSVRPRQRYSPVTVSKPAAEDVIVLSSDDEQPPKARAPSPRRKRSKPKNRAPIPATADVVEISSGEEDVVITRARIPPQRQPDVVAQLQRQLKAAEKEVERLRKDLEAREAEKRKAPPADAPVDNKLIGELDEIVSCEICTLKMWSPYALPCGHTFCQKCLQEWFGTTQAQHLDNYPLPPGLADELIRLRHALLSPLLPPPRRLNLRMQLEQLEALHRHPNYTCPTCRAQCRTRPTEVFAIKAIVERVAKAQGENAPDNAPARARGGPAQLITGPFDGFFPGGTR